MSVPPPLVVREIGLSRAHNIEAIDQLSADDDKRGSDKVENFSATGGVDSQLNEEELKTEEGEDDELSELIYTYLV